MRALFRTAWRTRRYRYLAAIIVCAMMLLTLASQLEILTLGAITQQGPTFFELFSPEREGRMVADDSITAEQLQRRWRELTPAPHEVVTQQDVAAFVATHKGGLHQRAVAYVEEAFDLRGHPLRLAFLLLAVAAIKAVFLFVYRYSARLAAISVSAELRLRYFEHLQALPMAFYQRHNIGTLSSRAVSDAASIADALNACLVNYLQTPFTVLSTLALCLAISWQLTLLIFLGFPLIIYPILFLAQRVRRISKQLLSNQEHFASVLIDFLAGIQTVKVFAMEQFSLDKYRQHNRQMAALERRSARYDLSSRPIIHTIGMFFLASALLCGLYLLHMEVSQVLVFCGLLYVFYEPIKKFAEENSHIQRGIAAAERMYEVLEQEERTCDAPGAIPLPTLERSIGFQNVWFRYQDDWILKDVTFSVAKGEMVALVGSTGAGKSTIVQLLPRLYEPQQGAITIDDLPLAAYQQSSLRNQIGFVPQRPFLFLDTVAANIAFGRPYSEAEIIAAAKRAHAHDFIEQLPQGYATVLSDAGGNLSGGQQQRLAIARALIKKAPILVLDEATSALDAVSERHIKLALRDLRGDITQVIIAHRLSTIEDADKIIYLEAGRIVDMGTQDELLSRCAPFRTLWEAALRTMPSSAKLQTR